VKTYTTRSGATQYKPSFTEIQEAAESNDGFCLACGNVQSGVEPDARGYACESCGALKVYGAEELALMGIMYNDEEDES
jgi:Zn finger protein HypA/HybF involved in hydrogenase expression